ncbi:hypothetical protein [Neobacillus niacini]|uniref:hypothetical protein n=1 Tax=Neobacillus niacini TaxID=86668 RepID=UPI0021CB4062|nr:hypothetical protein [Neobacillus niacini]MCM3764282.1 hypothetical protein [Neobacillus niacini]
MKAKIILFMIGMLVSVPFAAGANEVVPDTNVDNQEQVNNVDNSEECDCEAEESTDQHGTQGHGHKHGDWQAKMADREKQLLGWVDQYTPDKKDEWTQVLEEKKQLRNEWMSPNNAEKREKWRSEKLKKMKELHKQLEEGKITKEEFIKEAHGGKDMARWKMYHDLKLAVEKKDDKLAAEGLNQLLEQYKQHNQRLKEKLDD